MYNLFRRFFFLIIFSFIAQILFSQGKVNQCMVKLNKIHMQGRLMFTGKVPQLYLNKEDKILDLGNYFLYIEKVEAIYSYEARELPTKKYHGVKFRCIEDDCIKSSDFGYSNNITNFFKSKKDCYNFINAFNELKKSLE